MSTQLYGFKYSYLIQISIWFINEILTGITTGIQSGLESNDNEEVLHTSQISTPQALPSNAVS